jgi:hypothetical protein
MLGFSLIPLSLPLPSLWMVTVPWAHCILQMRVFSPTFIDRGHEARRGCDTHDHSPRLPLRPFLPGHTVVHPLPFESQ